MSNIQHHYTELADIYDAHWDSYLTPYEDWILQRLPTEAQSVIDLGCGTGRMLAKISKHYPKTELHGIDTTSSMLKKAKETCPNATFAQADLNHYAPETTHDVILSLSVFHHLQNQDDYLESIKAAAHEGSTIFFCDFAIDTWKLKAAETYWRIFHSAHHKAYSSKTIKTKLETAGFDILNHETLKADSFWRIQVYALKKRP